MSRHEFDLSRFNAKAFDGKRFASAMKSMSLRQAELDYASSVAVKKFADALQDARTKDAAEFAGAMRAATVSDNPQEATIELLLTKLTEVGYAAGVEIYRGYWK